MLCLASLAAPRPLMFHFALASSGGLESARGREFADRWRYAEFRHVFKLMTVVWGTAYVVHAGVSVAIIESTSTNRAFLINKILPYVFLAVLGAWTAVYGIRAKRRGEAIAITSAALPQTQAGQPARSDVAPGPPE